MTRTYDEMPSTELDVLLRRADPLAGIALEDGLAHSPGPGHALTVLLDHGRRRSFAARLGRLAVPLEGGTSRLAFVGAMACVLVIGSIVVTRSGAPTLEPTVRERPASTIDEPPPSAPTDRSVLEVPAPTQRSDREPVSPATEPDDAGAPSTPATVEPQPATAGTGADDPCLGEGPTVVEARQDYDRNCALPRADCDLIGTTWRCSSEQLGDRPSQVTAAG